MTGTIGALHDDGLTGSILGDDGRRYFLVWKNMQQLSPLGFADLRVGDRVTFTPVESDRARDDPRAIEVRAEGARLDGW